MRMKKRDNETKTLIDARKDETNLDFSDDIHSLYDGAKHNVLAVQPVESETW
jgi:hypothetical protein